MEIQFSDVNDGKRKVYWFTEDGKFLCTGRKPFYKYLAKTPKRRWLRFYKVELEEGEKVIEYGRWGAYMQFSGWKLLEVEADGSLKELHSEEGPPPHIQEWLNANRKPKSGNTRGSGSQATDGAVLGD